MSKKYVLLSLVFAFALQVYAQRQDEMKKTVAFLASQELGGRFPVQQAIPLPLNLSWNGFVG